MSLFVACERNDFEPFAGKDNYIVSFTLKQGETTLDASVVEGTVRVTAPETLSLEGAKAEVRLSEHASIKPDPSTVTAWNEDQVFTVVSFGGKQRSYVYSVTRTRIDKEGTVVLATQADVDAFGQLGIAVVKGNLIVGRLGGTDSIASLLPLAALKEVGYGLIIHQTYTGENLVGLEGLERVGDVLQIGACPHLETVALPALERVGGIDVANTSTIIADMPALTRAEGPVRLYCPLYQSNFSALKHARNITLYTANNSGAMLAEISFPALETVGDIGVSLLMNATKINLPELRSSGNLAFTSLSNVAFVYAPRLETAGNISVSNMPALTEIDFPSLVKAQNLTLNQATLRVAEFPKLAEVEILTVTDTPIGGLASFPALKTAGSVVFYYNNMLDVETLTVPANVERIGSLSVETRRDAMKEIDIRGGKVGELKLLANSARSKVKGDAVFEGTLVVNSASASQPYPAFPELEGFAEIDSLFVNGTFTSLHLTGIRKLHKNLRLNSGSTLPEASLPDMEEIDGSLTLFPLYNFTMNTFGAPKLKRVGGDLIANDPGSRIPRLNFPLLENIGGNCSLNTGRRNDNPLYDQQIEVLYFPKLTSVGGVLSIRSSNATNPNTALKNLDGLSALRTVKAVSVTGQMGLESFDGLKPAVRNISPEDWSATDNRINPTYEEMTR